MNNDNTVQIGVALKWRNTFDITKRYYQENVVTVCGCVFRCKVLQAQGKSPVNFTDAQGHMVYTNTDTWDVLVDMAYYYNYSVDTKKLTQETLNYVKQLDEAIKRQQGEIKAIQEDDKKQWEHINAIEKINDEQQRELNAAFDTFSCFSEGIWIDTLLWSNVTIWDNNKYAITDDLQNQINELAEQHCQDIEDLTEKHDQDLQDLSDKINEDIEQLTEKHNSELASLTTHIRKREKRQNFINKRLQEKVKDIENSLCCFGTGFWENGMPWNDVLLWENSRYAITDALSEELETLTKRVGEDEATFDQAILENSKAHGLVNAHLERHDKEIKNLQDLISVHDKQIIDLIDTLSCFSSGQWDNGLKWSNTALWENSNLMMDSFEDVYAKIANNVQSINNLTTEIQKVRTDAAKTLQEINQTFATFKQEHEDFSKEHKTFREEHQGFTGRMDGIDRLNEEQQREVDTLLYRISVISNGMWDNNLLWVNNSEWTNSNLSGSCQCPQDTDERLDDLEDVLGEMSVKLEEANEDIMTNLSLITAQHQIIQKSQETLDDIRGYNGCFEKGEWASPFYWNDSNLWYNSPYSMSEAESEIIDHDTRLTTLESQLALLLQKFSDQQTIIERQQNLLDTFTDSFSVLNLGKWQNMLFWDNSSKWSNVMITEAAADGGVASVVVKDYDPETQTLYM